MPGYKGAESAEAPAIVEKDPHTKLQEVCCVRRRPETPSFFTGEFTPHSSVH